MLCNRAIAAIFVVASQLVVTAVAAQTLTNPYPRTDPFPASEKPLTRHPRNQACSGFGAGFAQIPGTDTCVKIGGYMRFEATGR